MGQLEDEWDAEIAACPECGGRGYIHKLTPMPGGRSAAWTKICFVCSRARMVDTPEEPNEPSAEEAEL